MKKRGISLDNRLGASIKRDKIRKNGQKTNKFCKSITLDHTSNLNHFLNYKFNFLNIEGFKKKSKVYSDLEELSNSRLVRSIQESRRGPNYFAQMIQNGIETGEITSDEFEKLY